MECEDHLREKLEGVSACDWAANTAEFQHLCSKRHIAPRARSAFLKCVATTVIKYSNDIAADSRQKSGCRPSILDTVRSQQSRAVMPTTAPGHNLQRRAL
jgi:hypothetical protein